MYAHLGSQLHQIAGESFEDLCCLVPDDDIDDGHLEAQVEKVCRVDFEGDLVGSLVLRFCGGLAELVGSNMVGEEGLDEEQHNDSFAELAQAICSRFLPAVSDQEHELDFSGPIMLELEWSSELDDMEATAMAQLPFDKGRVDVMLFLDESTELHVLDRAS